MPSISRPLRSGLIIALFLTTAISSLRIPLLPEIGAQLDVGSGEIGVITAVFGFGRIITNIPAGRIADRLSPALSSLFAALFMTAGTTVIALAPGFAQLLVGIAITGSASAMMNTTAMTTLTRSAAPGKRGAAMATYSTSLMTGQIVGPALAGVSAAVLSWRITHGIGAGIALAIALTMLVLWLNDGRSRRAAASRSGSDLVAAGTPVDDSVPDMRRIHLVAVSSVSFAVFFSLSALPQTVLPLIAANELRLPVEQIGFAIGASAIARIIGARIAGRIADVYSRRAALIPSLILLAASPLLIALPLGWGGWLAALMLISLASSGAAIAGTVIGDLSRPARLGARMGIYRTLGDVGLLVGGLVCGLSYELGGRLPTALLAAGICAAATVLACIILPREGSGHKR